jgi:hypothetical protein
MQWKTITATVMRKGDERPGKGCYLIVRSSVLTADKVVTISYEDYARLDAGMLV